MRRSKLHLVVLAALVAASPACKKKPRATGDDAGAPVGSVAASAAPPASAVAVAPPPAPSAPPPDTPPPQQPAQSDFGSADCLELAPEGLAGKPTALVGTVYSGTASHPNGESFEFFALTLKEPKCVVGIEDVPAVTEVQIYTDDEKTKLKSFVGKKVRLEGDPFGEHTAWHVRPVVVRISKIGDLASAGCITVDEAHATGDPLTIEGKLARIEQSLPGGATARIYELTLASSRCVDGLAMTKNVTSVQLEPPAGKPIDPLIGRKVRVTGTPRPSRTPAEGRPVVVSVDTIAKI